VNTAVVWREEALTRLHDRAGFDCGVPALNAYLQRYARQNHDSGGAKTFVAVAPKAPTIILGYYTISPGAIAFAKAPETITKKLGRYEVPVFRLGRLAVSRGAQSRGLGGDLLLAAGGARSGWCGARHRRQRRAGGSLVRAFRCTATAGRSFETGIAPGYNPRRSSALM
jgi:hypothetical protein